MKLHELKPSEGSRKNRKRVGRGPGGTDKTAGRGHKGQKSRSGAGKGSFFEGGRSTLISRLPKRGFNNVGTTYEIVKLSHLEATGMDVLDREALDRAHQLYREHGLDARDDSIGMKYYVDGWSFDPKRPCLVR